MLYYQFYTFAKFSHLSFCPYWSCSTLYNALSRLPHWQHSYVHRPSFILSAFEIYRFLLSTSYWYEHHRRLFVTNQPLISSVRPIEKDDIHSPYDWGRTLEQRHRFVTKYLRLTDGRSYFPVDIVNTAFTYSRLRSSVFIADFKQYSLKGVDVHELLCISSGDLFVFCKDFRVPLNMFNLNATSITKPINCEANCLFLCISSHSKTGWNSIPWPGMIFEATSLSSSMIFSASPPEPETVRSWETMSIGLLSSSDCWLARSSLAFYYSSHFYHSVLLLLLQTFHFI